MMNSRLVIGMSGASGSIYGIRLLQILAKISEVETHLIMSAPAKQTALHETGFNIREIEKLADYAYDYKDIGATIASGSFKTLGMVVAPCSIKTLSSIANSYSDNLLSRAADVTLKEGRPLVLVLRETPLHKGHLRLMLNAAEAGAIIFPPVPAFYIHPKTLDDIVNHAIGRILDRLNIDQTLVKEWQGIRQYTDT
jgi:4-hydroxy-3-polyprenylbenzoate decarboxylase